ncbi:MAG: 6-pyruvoyl-tetrahydropterin synthase-related protein [Pyrinomonadaceae bacterium]
MQHMRFAGAYYDSIVSGDMIPLWSANDNYGFGGIGIRYYPPVAYIVLALTKLLTGNWFNSFFITTYFWALLGSFGVFYWMRRWTSDNAALIAAAFYAIIPYHTFQIYQAVLYAEFAASGILPFCFLFLTDVCRRRRWSDALLFAISYSLLILTHIPTAIIATLSLGVYGLFIVDRRRIFETALKLSAAFVASFAAVAFHVVKAVIEVDWVKHNSAQYFANGYYDYKNYLFPIYFSTTTTRYVQKMLWHFDTIILVTLCCFVVYFALRYRAAIGSTLQNHDFVRQNRAVIFTGLFSVLMLSIVSLVVWNNVSLLAKIQFPWRWLSVVSIMASVLFGIGANATLSGTKRFARLAGYPVLLFVCIVVFYDISQNILPSTPLDRTTFEEKVAGMYNERACECWWPNWATDAALENKQPVSIGERSTEIIGSDPLIRRFKIGAGAENALRAAIFYHPHWKAEFNGVEVPVTNSADGAISVNVPAEQGELTLRFVEPARTFLLQKLSAFVWVLFALGAFSLAWKRYARPLELTGRLLSKHATS